MGRPKKKTTEVREPVTAALLPIIVTELNSVAEEKDRTRSYVIEKLLMRGIFAYQRDGLLEEPQPLDGMIVPHIGVIKLDKKKI